MPVVGGRSIGRCQEQLAQMDEKDDGYDEGYCFPQDEEEQGPDETAQEDQHFQKQYEMLLARHADSKDRMDSRVLAARAKAHVGYPTSWARALDDDFLDADVKHPPADWKSKYVALRDATVGRKSPPSKIASEGQGHNTGFILHDMLKNEPVIYMRHHHPNTQTRYTADDYVRRGPAERFERAARRR